MAGAGGLEFFQYLPELFLHERFLSSAHRTLDPREADFFLVPVWAGAARGLQSENKYMTRAVAYIRTHYTHWDDGDNGRNHIFVMAPTFCGNNGKKIFTRKINVNEKMNK
jgi:hypothetical protein